MLGGSLLDEPGKDNSKLPKKRSRKGHLDVNTKEMVLNMYEREMEENPTMVVEDIVRRVANIAGVSDRSVYKIIKEYKDTHVLSAPKTNHNRKSTLDFVDKNSIRSTVHEFFFNNDFPTLDKALKKVNDDTALPNFKRTTFYKLLKKLNFNIQRCGKNNVLIDRDEIILWRRDYLRKIRSYRNESRKIYYLGETYLNIGDTKCKISAENSIMSTENRNFTGNRTLFRYQQNSSFSYFNYSYHLISPKLIGIILYFIKHPQTLNDFGDTFLGERKSFIICTIGNEDGFVPDSLLVFKSQVPGRYNDEMDGKSFENWFANTLPKLEDNSVIVLNNAPCHSRKTEKIPTTIFTKSEIEAWLRSKNIYFEKTMLKVQLLEIVNKYNQKYDKYVIDEVANNQNKTILWLPPYHDDLNPMELIWKDVRNFIVNSKIAFQFEDIKCDLFEPLKTITPEKWKKYIESIQQNTEQKIWYLDNIIETYVESTITDPNYNYSSGYKLDKKKTKKKCL